MEHTEEKFPKTVKHLNEKIPPQADIWGKVWKKEVHAVGRIEEFKGGGDKVGEADEGQERSKKQSALCSGKFLELPARKYQLTGQLPHSWGGELRTVKDRITDKAGFLWRSES